MPEQCVLCLEEVFQELRHDPAFFAKAIGDVARARGMRQAARAARISREGHYKALPEDRNAGFATTLKVLAALGLRLHFGGLNPPDRDK